MPKTTQPTVLIVEDDNEIRMVYSYALNNHGIKVLQAANAAEAVRLLEQLLPDVILLDMLMAGTSGLDFLKLNNVHSRFPDVKIIAFSNVDTPRVVDQAVALGVTQYLLKVNVTPGQMVNYIHELTGTGA